MTSMFLVFDGTYDKSVKNRIAVIRGNRFQKNYVRWDFPEAEIVFCDDIYSGFDMVKSGAADSIVINELRKDALMSSFRYRDMQSVPLPEGRNICMAVKRGKTVNFPWRNLSTPIFTARLPQRCCWRGY
ncbi:hypothetical protein ACTQ56_12930 [[Clostridium] aminophilum]|uniref:hypothetical protein n=1 Tax=[Clostridium] aminophilum TaxID=1526 RepID=UPI003F98771F